MSVELLQQLISPKFTKQALLDVIYKKNRLHDIKINKIAIADMDSKKGESYASNSCKFILEASGKNTAEIEETLSIPFFVKYLPKNVVWRKTYRTDEFFENEIIFYEKVWPILEQFQQSKNKTIFDNIPPILSTYSDAVNDYIAMLDVNFEGYKTLERNFELNYEHAMGILKILGRFHALSLALKDQQPQVFEKIAQSLKEVYCAEKYRKWYVPFQEKLASVVRNAVEIELPPIYLEKFDKMLENDLYGTMCKLCERIGPFSVITHGDVWKPNFLMKSQEQGTDKFIMIDFQLARCANLGTDLTFFFYCCLDMNALETHWDDFIKQYYTALVEGLEAVGSNRNLITLKDVLEEIRIHNTFGVGMAIEGVTMSLMDENTMTDLSAIEGEDGVPLASLWTLSPFKEQKKRKKVASFIKFSVDKQFL